MEWISIKTKKPDDEQAIFVINCKVDMLPLKAYYYKDYDEFFSLEVGTGTNHPVSITHWMPFPKFPEEFLKK